jgi:hypothetical protein
MVKRKHSVLNVLNNDSMNLLGNLDEDGEYEAEQSGHILVNGEDDEESDENDEQKCDEDDKDVEDIVMMSSLPSTASKMLGKRKDDSEGKSLSIASSSDRIHCLCHTDTDNRSIIKKNLSITTAIEMKKPALQ